MKQKFNFLFKLKIINSSCNTFLKEKLNDHIRKKINTRLKFLGKSYCRTLTQLIR